MFWIGEPSSNDASLSAFSCDRSFRGFEAVGAFVPGEERREKMGKGAERRLERLLIGTVALILGILRTIDRGVA